MGKLGITTDVLNQKGSPALYQDLFGNIPAAGYTGRLFVSTDTNNLYRDNGSSWVQVAGSSGGSGVTSITGTANQVIASAATGAVVLSLPQNINVGASPTFAGITLSGLSSAGIVINNGSGVLSTTNGTGFVKISGGTISYDNSTYLTTAAASAAYQPLITLTTTGASGAASFTSNTLNVPAYTLAGLGGISLTALSASSPLSYNSGTGAFAIQVSNTSQAGYLTATDWNTFNGKQAQINGTGFVKASGTTISYDNSTYITLSALSASSPLSYNSGTGAFAIQVANTSQAGYLSQSDWNTFNSKQSTITLTTTGASGAASFTSNTLNVPAYTLAGLGGISLTALSASSPLSYNNATGAFAIQVANTSQAGYLTASDWNTFNGKQAQINGTGFVKAAGTTISYDNSTYLTTTTAASTYVPYSGATGTVNLNAQSLQGISATSGNSALAFADVSGIKIQLNGNGGSSSNYYTIEKQSAVAGGDGLFKFQAGNIAGGEFGFYSGGIQRLLIASTGAATFASSVSATGAIYANSNVITSDLAVAKTTLLGTVYSGNGNLYGGIKLTSSSATGFNNTVDIITSNGSGGISAVTFNPDQTSSFHAAVSVSSTLSVTGNIICSSTGFFSTLSVAGYTYTSSQTITTGYLIVYGTGGIAGQTLTLPAASGTNQQLFFKNISSNIVTISRAGSDNLIALNTSTTSTTLNLLSGGQCGFVSDGGSKWIQQY